jgi:hypothetical protein
MVSVGACETVGQSKKRKKCEKMQKVSKEGQVHDALKELEDKMPFSLKHVFVKRQQARFVDDKKDHLTKEEAVIQVDPNSTLGSRSGDTFRCLGPRLRARPLMIPMSLFPMN